MANHLIVDWRVLWDVDNRMGRIDLDPDGPGAWFTLPPQHADDFAAACQILQLARASGKPLVWNTDQAQLFCGSP